MSISYLPSADASFSSAQRVSLVLRAVEGPLADVQNQSTVVSFSRAGNGELVEPVRGCSGSDNPDTRLVGVREVLLAILGTKTLPSIGATGT